MTSPIIPSRAAINPFYRKDETEVVKSLLDNFPIKDDTAIRERAAGWIKTLRAQPSERTLLEDFMQRYSLSTQEGVALMAIAECFLRVPDTDMADQVVIDKITSADWQSPPVEGEKLLTRLSGWGLNISEAVLGQQSGTFGKLAQRLGLPVIRQAIAQAIKLLGGQFVCGRTIEEAIQNASNLKRHGELFSYDMLGEGARMAQTAENYFQQYKHAIETVGKTRAVKDLYQGDSISVKLSALHPRYEEMQKDKCFPILIDRLKQLALLAKQYDVMLTVDAEEADRLELSFDIFEAVLTDPLLAGYNGLGLAVQAYQKRATCVIDYLIDLARTTNKRIPIRLVKGAYWDSEIKRGQERGLSGYPVFTRKQSTDVSYLVCADKMLAAHDVLYPAFATHNALTISIILDLAKKHRNASYEFQRLHGMGQNLYDAAYKTNPDMPPCRVYAPVGAHQDLLPYLVRRLLENGANSSFVHQVYDKNLSINTLTENPATYIKAQTIIPHPKIPLPIALFPDRQNSVAPDLSDRAEKEKIMAAIWSYQNKWQAPEAETTDPSQIMQASQNAFLPWKNKSPAERADCLDRVADIYEQHRDELLALCMYEGKKTVPDAILEWREAIDFCRYYAQQARDKLHIGILPGPTGEKNTLQVEGRGVFVCISPWNFPLAIFTGQVVAALVAGNSVVAKPAEQTPRIAQRAIALMHQAGIPKDVVQLAIGSGSNVGAALVAHKHTAGIAFTGSTDTAWIIQKSLANKKGPIIPFIAETGGQNAMIVDGTALPEQVVDDVIRSAFLSAGQRCSALRVLFLQDNIAPHVIDMLKGAMAELVIGDPAELSTDIGPVIDEEAQNALLQHADIMQDRRICAAQQDTGLKGSFILPQVFKISRISDLYKENFGPLLHIITYKANELDNVIDQINAIGYGLTLGIHTRIEGRAENIAARVNVGNVYINRGQTGAVVGVQPFGGMGLSGTGPKAGGPHYLYRFVTERAISINTTAAGGNTSLTMLSDTP